MGTCPKITLKTYDEICCAGFSSGDANEDVILRFGFHIERQLLHPKINAACHLIQPGKLEVHARGGNPKKFPHALHDAGFSGAHLKESAEDGAQHEKREDYEEEPEDSLGRVHAETP